MEGWDAALPPGMEGVLAAVLDEAAPGPCDVVVDLGCGTGQLSLPLARQAGSVLAVDVSPPMIDRLRARAAAEGLANLEGRVIPIETLELPDASIDLVVSNYALHHLRDADKQLLVTRAARWLRPGGALVVGDMMFGRGANRRDRAIIASKVSVFMRRGPAGWWRVAKNGGRFLLRVQERPVAIGRWESWLRAAGFEAVTSRPVVAEAAVVWGRLPHTPTP